MQMGRRGLRAWAEVCTSKVLVWSRVCGEVGLVGQQMNQVLRRVSKDSNRDRKLNEMDRGDSHFIQKQNLRELKKKIQPHYFPSALCHFTAQGWTERATPDVSRSRKSAHRQPVSIIPSRNLSCHNVLFLRYLKKNCDSG